MGCPVPCKRATFPRTVRLLQGVQYRNVFDHGSKFVCAGFVLFAVANHEPHARLGMALAKRRLHRAVDRSRVRRLVRESFRHARHSLPALDVVVLARNGTASMDSKELSKQLAGLWGRLVRSAPARSAAPRNL